MENYYTVHKGNSCATGTTGTTADDFINLSIINVGMSTSNQKSVKNIGVGIRFVLLCNNS